MPAEVSAIMRSLPRLTRIDEVCDAVQYRTAVGATCGDVEARAQQCLWIGFTADSRWFGHVGRDIGVAGLDPDRRRLAVLAATDTDVPDR
jgi:hypothetical protein